MKKKLLLVLIPLLIASLSACVKYNGQGKGGSKSSKDAESTEVAPSSDAANTSEENPVSSDAGQSSTPAPSSSQQGGESELPAGTEVTTYLVFGEYGKYQGELVSNKIPALFLEHAIEFKGKVGDALPGKTEVTSSVTNSQFVAWTAYNNDGKLTEYTKVPGVDKKILYASFSGGNGGTPSSGSVTPVDPPVGDVTYTVTNLPDWIQNDGCVIFAWVWSNTDGGSWKTLSYGTNNDASFKVTSELNGFLLARCASGTTAPDWSITADGPGRIYNQTEDITCSSGTYSYACADWKAYNPS